MIRLEDPQPAGPPPGLVPQVEEIFSPKGLLSRSPNFEFRPQQQLMAVAAARALEEGKNLIVEAGTGVGKSLAYLIPSILFAVARRKKAIISTHTINLQEQLILKDLPMLARVLPVKFQFTMLKGRHNYLMHPPPGQGPLPGPPAFHLPRRGGIGAHLGMVPKNRGRQPLGLRRRAGPQRLAAGLFGARLVQSPPVRARVGLRQGGRRGPVSIKRPAALCWRPTCWCSITPSSSPSWAPWRTNPRAAC